MLHFLFAQAAPAAPLNWYDEPWFMITSVLVVLVAPYFIGEWLGRRLRMPDYGWKIGLILTAIVAGVTIDYFRWPPKLGIDLSGGVKLIYQLDQGKLRSVNVDQLLQKMADAANAPGFGSKKAEVHPLDEGRLEVKLPTEDPTKVQQASDAISRLDFQNLGITVRFISSSASDGGTTLVYQADHRADAVDMNKLINAVVKRVNPGGQREVAIRRVGSDQIEVAIPDVDKAEIEQIKEKIATAGALEFRIVADRRLPEHHEAIEAAKAEIKNPSNEVSNGRKIVGQWVDLGKDEPPNPTWLTREMKGKTQVLVIRDDYNVTGAYLTNARMGYGDKGVEVEFSFDSQGARRFGELTGTNLADPSNGIKHELAIILDNTLMSAASIESRISDSGRISGRFTEERVNTIVDVLNAGALPAALQKQPLSEDHISAELGQDTVRNSYLSMIVSTAAVLLFMLFYYRFAGIVANAAVILNLVLVLALMIVFKAAFTLAGLAGLVLSVGMAVDSNVLIYERMREEKERGAAMRMVIRNGFGRAMATIIDTHSTTIITGVILYIIGTEQLRGFAVTLVMGLVVNLFTAVFCARVVFDIAERKRWLTELKMLKLFGETHIDFVSIMKPAIVVSILISVAGLFALWERGRTILDVDFTGGSEVQIAFEPNKAMDVSAVRKALEDPSVAAKLPDATVNAVTSASVTENTQFIIRTSNDNLKNVEAELAAVFGDRLRHYQPAKRTDLHLIEASASGAGKPAERPAVESTRPQERTSTTTTAAPATTTTKPAHSATSSTSQSSPPKSGGNPPVPEKTDNTPPPSPPSGSPKGTSLSRLNRALLAFAAPELFVADDSKPATTGTSAAASTTSTAAAATSTTQNPPPAVPPAPTTTSTAAAATSTTQNPPPTVPAAATTTSNAPATTSSAVPSTTTSTAPAAISSDTGARSPGLTVEDSFVGGTSATLQFPDPIKHDALKALIDDVLPSKSVRVDISNPQYSAGDDHPYKEWTVRLSVPPAEGAKILDALNTKLATTPVYLSDSTIGSRVAESTQWTAAKALVVSIV
ncbi:MAG TPA: protein translocase subunit SecD, partial [Pirellulales bacterium]